MSAATVQTPYGVLVGKNSGSGLAFLGVRYGEAPIGARRWRAPRAHRPAGGVTDATTYGASPSQIASPATSWRPAFEPRAMDEDCLNLNVWTPAADDARRPVLVHVFGGGFERGSASDGPQDGAALSARADVVVVRVNFRIGALGFLYLGDELAPGNAGVLDLVLALEWVRENISALGGDADNVTLFGISSGAFMIAALFAMPAARGLFAKTWMQSGSASRVLTPAQAADFTTAFFCEAGVAPGNRAALENLPIEAILSTQRKVAALDLGDRNAPGGLTLGVVEDGMSLPEHPLRAFERGDHRGVPVVLGHTRDEARLWFATGAMRLPHKFEEVEAEAIQFGGPRDGARLFAFYREQFPDADPRSLREKFLTDAVYVVPALRTAQAHARAGGDAFLYRFDWTPFGDNAGLGAAHGFDEVFVWDVADAEHFPPSAGDRSAPDLGAAMNRALVDFAHDGSPGWAPLKDVSAVRIFGDPRASYANVDEALLNAWRGVERR